MSGGKPVGRSEIPFTTGEKLTYQMVWNLIPVGYFTVEVVNTDSFEGVPAWHFKMRVKTNGFADTFYKVRNSVDAYAHKSLSYSLKYDFDQNQGKKDFHTVLTFKPSPPKVHFICNDEDKGWAELPEPCVDPLTMFYVVRTRELKKVGDTVYVWVSDGEKHIKCPVEILLEEEILVNDVPRKAFLLQPDLKEMHGVFQRSKGAKLRVWVSADNYKIPLKVASRVVVGSFEARLVEFETGRESSTLPRPLERTEADESP